MFMHLKPLSTAALSSAETCLITPDSGKKGLPQEVGTQILILLVLLAFFVP